MAERQTGAQKRKARFAGADHAGQRPKNLKKTAKRLLSYIARKKWLLALVGLLVLINSSATVAGTYFLKPLINVYIIPLIGKAPDASMLLPLAAALAKLGGLFAAGATASYLQVRIMLYIAHSTLNTIRKELFESVQRLPVKFFDKHTHGELMSRFTNDTDAIQTAFEESIVYIFTYMVTITGTFVMMLVLSPVLTAMLVLMLVLMVFIIRKVGGVSAVSFKAQQEALGCANGYIEEMIGGQKTVKAYSCEDKAKQTFSDLNGALRAASTKANTFANIILPIMGNLSYINYAITALAGAYLAVNGRLDIGSVAAFLQYTRSIGNPITHMSQQINAILAAFAGAERIFDVIDTQPEPDAGNVIAVPAVYKGGKLIQAESGAAAVRAWKTGDALTGTEGRVCFDNISFSYDGKREVLRNVTIKVDKGRKIALVGSTGAGKTTLTNLLNRFYEIEKGAITFDGIDIRAIKKDDLRRSLSTVLQDVRLFKGTVEENIRYGRLEATREEVVAAAKLANAHSFITRLPDGYDTLLTADGSNLSAGQRQLISIARAAISNAPVLVLDEATASIDTRTESLIEQGISKLMQGKTVFIIAHRLSTVRNADRIIVMENGGIIEQGSHEELITQQGSYYKLYTGKFELD